MAEWRTVTVRATMNEETFLFVVEGETIKKVQLEGEPESPSPPFAL